MDNRKMFQRRHYEALAHAMAKMVPDLDNIEAQSLMSLSKGERTRLKAEIYTSVMQSLIDMLRHDNPAFNEKLFKRTFQTYLRNQIVRRRLDLSSPSRYTMVDDASPIGWKEIES